MTELEAVHRQILRRIPKRINDMDVLLYLQKNTVNYEYVQTLKRTTRFNDELLSGWLNVNIKTFRTYKKADQEINISTREHVLMLLSLTQHGIAVFGSIEKFQEWLDKENFYFNNQAPKAYLNTVTGIRFVDGRLTAMEYGDNV
ncbi:antitoxin Xre/MbcA/ParS toxin-binding domain-containing protein [Roseivirga sp. BDSF3-8]|uniref:antitoxin Xre/MbcA/ParS toxin-binding domain-containing protein n=1 Tax=Roseivirga sp. BDSF3-8 TaxID=3241598 RepID=UPI0035326D12